MVTNIHIFLVDGMSVLWVLFFSAQMCKTHFTHEELDETISHSFFNCDLACSQNVIKIVLANTAYQ